jgi:hypothetical protein
MAVVLAKFDADFSGFEAGTNQAIKDLQAFEANAETTMDSVVVSVDDMAQAFEDMKDPITGMTTEYGAFDSLLKAGGINLTNYSRAMTELGSAVGLSEKAMGLIGPAMLAVGAAMAGWKIGTAIAEWTGLHKIIGDATANLLGWGDAAGEAAGARTDAMNLAFERTGEVARDAAHALEINTRWLKDNQAAVKANAAEQKAAADFARESLAARKASEIEFYKFHDENMKRIEERNAKQREAANALKAAYDEVSLANMGWVKVIEKMNPLLVDTIKNLMAEGVSLESIRLTTQASELQLQAISRARQFDNEMLREAKTLKDEIIPVTVDLAAALYEEAAALDAEFAALRQVNSEKERAVGATRELAAASNAITFTPIPQGARGGAVPPSAFVQRASELGLLGMNAAAVGGWFGGNRMPLGGPMHASPTQIGGHAWGGGLGGGTSGPTHVVNVNGVLISDDPASRQALADAINMAMMGQLKGGGQQVGPGRA